MALSRRVISLCSVSIVSLSLLLIELSDVKVLSIVTFPSSPFYIHFLTKAQMRQIMKMPVMMPMKAKKPVRVNFGSSSSREAESGCSSIGMSAAL